MKKRSGFWRLLGVALALALLPALPAEACDKTSTTQITVQGNPANPNERFRADPVTVTHKIYYCTGNFECHSVTVEHTLDTGPLPGKTQSELAKELADKIKAALPEPLKSSVKVVDNVITITGTNSCSGTGDPATGDKPGKQPPDAKKMDLHTSQRTWPL